jgi:hypothetical protein
MRNTAIKRYYRVDRHKIHYLKFILEGYDGVAVMRTLDAQKGLVVLHIGPGCEAEVDMIIEDLKRYMLIETAKGVERETIGFVLQNKTLKAEVLLVGGQ